MAKLRAQAMSAVLLLGCANHLPTLANPTRAQLPALHFYRQADVYRLGIQSWLDPDPEPIPALDGILVYEQAGKQPLEPGDKLLVLQYGSEVTHVTVTEDRCPPAVDCLTCDTHWTKRVAGPAINWNNVAAIIGPFDEGTFLVPADAIPIDWSTESGLIVTQNGVRLRERRECTSEYYVDAICETTTEFVLADEIRELSRWSTHPAPTVPQVFGVFDRSGFRVPMHGGPMGGGGQVVIDEWHVAPARPVADATYWLVSSTAVVGSVRFDPPYDAAFCSFLADLCWSTKAIELPPPSIDVALVIGPVPEPAPAMQARVAYDDGGRLAARIGAPEQPWVVISSRAFDCREDGPRWMKWGTCFETVTETAELRQRRVTFLPDVERARAWDVCVEHTRRK